MSSESAGPETPEAAPERRVSPVAALAFYGLLSLAAWIWLAGTGRQVADLWIPRDFLLEIALGLGCGLLMVGVSPWLVGHLRACRELEREFGWLIGQQRTWECVLLALASGVAEEFFFRGAVQSAVGPVLATFVFASLHWPVSPPFRVWPVIALAAGAVLAAEQLFTGTLIAPILTHVTVNMVNLLRITAKYRVWKD